MNIIDQIDRDIAALKARKAAIQEKCSHPDITSTKRGDSGNTLTGREESSWACHTCNLCSQTWTTDR